MGGSREICEPLVPSLARQVYVNRFAAAERALFMAYNATGHTFAGPVLRIGLRPSEHVFDLLRGRPADVTREGDQAVVRSFLPRDEVACLLRVPGRLGAKRLGESLEVRVAKPAKGWRIALCDARGQLLAARPAETASERLSLADLPARSATPACVKLFDGARLLDIVGLPAKD